MKYRSIWKVLILLLAGGPTLTFSQSLPTEVKHGEPQIHFRGTVTDEENKMPLAYVNIGVLHHAVGTVSKENGDFHLAIGQDLANEIVQVSLVGYETQRIPVKDLLQKKDTAYQIKLSKSNIQLNEVVVSAKQLQEQTEGRQEIGGMFEVTFNESKQEASAKLGTEIGTKVKSKKYPAFLKDFNWYLNSNNFDKIKFRINLYSLKNNLPDTLLLNEEIYVEVENFKTGWNKINLEPYNISVDADFAITLQWVDHELKAQKNPKIWIPGTLTPFHTVYLRDGSQDKWIRLKGNISYYLTLLY